MQVYTYSKIVGMMPLLGVVHISFRFPQSKRWSWSRLGGKAIVLGTYTTTYPDPYEGVRLQKKGAAKNPGRSHKGNKIMRSL